MLFEKKIFLKLIWFSFLLAGNAVAQQADPIVSNDKSLSAIQELIDTLEQSDDEASKAQLRFEAEALRKSSDEKKVILASDIYRTHLGDAEMASAVRAEIVARFPNGLFVRNNEYNAIVLNTGQDSLPVLERKHEEWLKRFPPENFDKEDRDGYSYIRLHLARQWISLGNFEKALYHVQKLKGSRYYISGVNSYYNALQDKSDSTAITLVQDAYTAAVSYAESADEKIRESNSEPLKAISSTYAHVLYDQQQYAQVVQIIGWLMKEVGYSGYYATANVKTLLDAYRKLGKTQERVHVYEKLFVAEGVQEDLLTDAKVAYSELYGSEGDFESWITDLGEQNKLAMLEKYQKDMISKEAPAFALTNREGTTVSLADYKGKVVILDFWATWCVPCIASFPGMQAAVNKYRDDPEVEFLFIDTWQNEDNYKELVDTFMAENKYDFHVLFDEMKDGDKATVTAYGVKGIPTKVIIDKEGIICFEYTGAETNVNKLVNGLDTMIELAKDR